MGASSRGAASSASNRFSTCRRSGRVRVSRKTRHDPREANSVHLVGAIEVEMRGDPARVTDRLKACIQRATRTAAHRSGLGIAANAAIDEIVVAHNPAAMAAQKSMGHRSFSGLFAIMHYYVK